MDKLIVTAAITGAIHTPSMSDALPCTVEDIVDQAVAAHRAGAAVVHIHARDDEGRPSADVERYRAIGKGIKARCDVIICFTTGGSIIMTTEQRSVAVRHLAPEMGSFTPGSMNFSYHAMGHKKRDWKFAWEKDYLLGTEASVFSNPFSVIKEYSGIFAAAETRPEFEIFGVSMLENLAACIGQGMLAASPYLQFVLGIMGGMSGEVESLVVLLQQSRRLFNDFQWSVCGGGKNQYGLMAAAMCMGAAGVRVGLEDSLYISRGKLAKSNAETVEKIVRIAGEVGREIASSAEARRILGLKGLDKVAF